MQGNKRNAAVIILAAGLGTRMKSDKAKVLYEVSGKPMILYVVDTARSVVGDDVVVVVGHQAEKVCETVVKQYNVIYAYQRKQLGTGHAVLCAMPYLSKSTKEVIILCGDVPLLTSKTVEDLLEDHIEAKRDITVLAVDVDNPKGYGRILLDKNMNIYGIVEEKDATEEQKAIKTINTGIYCVRKDFLVDSLPKIQSDNAQGEFYLTDIIEIGHRDNKTVGTIIGSDYEEVIGVNDLDDLKMVEKLIHKKFSKKS